MTTLRTIIAAVLFAVTCAACSAPAPDDRGAGTVSATGTPIDLSFACLPKDAICEGNAVRTCVFDAASDSWLWSNPVACDYVCLSQTQPSGRPGAVCAECQPGSSTCDQTDGVRYRCDSTGHWQSAGTCGPRRCDCGGTYPSCKPCQ